MEPISPNDRLDARPGQRDWNRWIAFQLRSASSLLEQQGANPFRINAYFRAAETLEALKRDIRQIHADEGFKGLIALPNIGRSIATAIMEMLQTGRWLLLERLRGSLDPEKLYQTIPGIGPGLAAEIVSNLHVDTLEALETAAYDGRLEQVPGIGNRRLTAVRQALDSMLQRRRTGRRPADEALPPVALILDVDQAYRKLAEAGQLALITPRRFPSDKGPSLPILHTQRGAWHFTALYSNTPRAHQLGRTRDWVIIYYHTDDEPEGQCTVVTEHSGPLKHLRVVRGREAESGRAQGETI